MRASVPVTMNGPLNQKTASSLSPRHVYYAASLSHVHVSNQKATPSLHRPRKSDRKHQPKNRRLSSLHVACNQETPPLTSRPCKKTQPLLAQGIMLPQTGSSDNTLSRFTPSRAGPGGDQRRKVPAPGESAHKQNEKSPAWRGAVYFYILISASGRDGTSPWRSWIMVFS